MGFGGLGSRWRRLRFSIASTGLWRALADTAVILFAYHPEHDRTFDRPFATDTAGSVEQTDLGIEDGTAREQAIRYLPSPARVTRWMLDHIGVDPRTFTFVDLGCGKGRVVLIATEYPFAAILGVDISAELVRIARANLEKYRPAGRRCWNVEVRHGDATAIDFPATDLLIHLYHPFETAVTARVLARLEQSLASRPRRVVVAYLAYTSALPEVEAVFARFPWLALTRREHSVAGQYDWLFYST